MPAYKYKAISNDGAPVTGLVEAYDEYEAVAQIKESCSIVLSVSEASSVTGLLKRDIIQPKIKLKSMALLCSQFSILLSSGMPVVKAVRLIADQTSDKALRKLLYLVAEDVAGGYSMSQSFENKGGKLLPPAFIETLRAGEESGTVETSFKKLHVYYDKSAKVYAKVRSALMYPVFMAVLAAAVIAFIMGYTMPIFADLFESMNIEMPALTRFLIDLTNFIGSYWHIIFAALAVLIIAIKLYSLSEKGRLRFALMKLRLPALGKVNEMKFASQLANTMSTMLAAGLPLINTLEASARVIDNYYLSLRLGEAVAGLATGRSLGDCLRDCGCFPPMLVEMTSVGEESGTLEETLGTIGSYYDNEVAVATERALGLLQPAITLIMGILIGLIVIALYLPMFSMYGGM